VSSWKLPGAARAAGPCAANGACIEAVHVAAQILPDGSAASFARTTVLKLARTTAEANAMPVDQEQEVRRFSKLYTERIIGGIPQPRRDASIIMVAPPQVLTAPRAFSEARASASKTSDGGDHQ
jgi:hypothetical protein